MMASASNDFPDESEWFSRYRYLLHTFAEELRPEDVRDVKFMYEDHIRSTLDEISDGKDVLLALETCWPPVITPVDVKELKVIAKHLHFNDLVKKVEEYEQLEYVFDTEEIQVDSFIGRRSELDSIHEFLSANNSRIPAVFIHGFPGIGKTCLAKEIVSSLSDYHKCLSVDLREVNTIEAVFYALMNKLDQITLKHYDVAKLERILSKRKQACVILLDNADMLLDPGSAQSPNIVRGHFIKFLHHIAQVKNPRVKLLVTSRYDIRREGAQEKLFSMRLDKMSPKDSEKLIYVYSNYIPMRNEDVQTLAKSCGFHPLAMKIVAGRLKDARGELLKPIMKELCDKPVSGKTMDMFNLLELMELDGLESQGQVQSCLLQTFRALSPVGMQHTLLKLSVIPGQFSYKDALEICRNNSVRTKGESTHNLFPDYTDSMDETIRIQVIHLCHRNLLEFSSAKKSRRFKMHLLLRAAMAKIAKVDEAYSKSYKQAQTNFQRHYNIKLKQYCQTIDKQHKTASDEKNTELPNYLGLLDTHIVNVNSLKPEEIEEVSIALDFLLDTEHRLKYYTQMADAAEKQGLPTCQVSYLGKKAYHMAQAGTFPMPEIENELEKALRIFKKLPNQGSKEMKLIYAEYCRNAGLSKLTFQGKGAEQAHSKAVSLLKTCVEIREKLFPCHPLTCRAYMDLSNAHFEKEKHTIGLLKRNEIELSLKYGELAYKMRSKLGAAHFDMSTILLNIGSCYEAIYRFSEALGYYYRALKVIKDLDLENHPQAVDAWWNIATLHRKKKDYREAYEAAKKVLKMRQRDFGHIDHPDIMAALYLCGLVCFDQKDTEKAGKYLEESLCMSERLMHRGRETSYFWKRLKQTYIELLMYIDRDVDVKEYQIRFQLAESALEKKKKTMKETGQFSVEVEEEDRDEFMSVENDDGSPMLTRRKLKYQPDDISSSEEEMEDGLPDMDDIVLMTDKRSHRFPCCTS